MAALVLLIFKDLLLKQVVVVLDVRLQVSFGRVREHGVHRGRVTLLGLSCGITAVRLARVLPT